MGPCPSCPRAPAYHGPIVHAAPAYAPAPVAYKEAPEPYTYTYGVADDYSQSNFNAAETADAAGNVGGSYSVSLPDGRIQTVTYTADHTNGYVAEVSYSGEAVFPPPLLVDMLVRLVPLPTLLPLPLPTRIKILA